LATLLNKISISVFYVLIIRESSVKTAKHPVCGACSWENSHG